MCVFAQPQLAQFPDEDTAQMQTGWSVAIDGDYAVVGIKSSKNNTIAAFIYHREGGAWRQKATLAPKPSSPVDIGNCDVDIHGDYVILGRLGLKKSVDGNVLDYAAFVYKRNGDQWDEEAKLLPNDGEIVGPSQFGFVVAISEDYAVVGDRVDDTAVGAAYVFKKTLDPMGNATWAQDAKLIPSDASSFHLFGNSVDIDVNTIVIGAPRAPGAAYIFVLENEEWKEDKKLSIEGLNPNADFGEKVAIDGDYVIVGAKNDNDGGIWGGGAAYVFKRQNDSWSAPAKLLPRDFVNYDHWGTDVALDERFALISSTGDDDMGSESGSVYLYEREGEVWEQKQKFLAADGVTGDHFGHAIALSGGHAVIGAPSNKQKGENAGAVYLQPLSSSALVIGEEAEADGIFATNTALRTALNPDELENLTYFEEDPTTIRSALITLDVGGLASADKLVLPAFFGSGVTLTRTSYESSEIDEFRWRGESKDHGGNVSILGYQGYVEGVLNIDGREYAIEYVGGENTYILLELDKSQDEAFDDDAGPEFRKGNHTVGSTSFEFIESIGIRVEPEEVKVVRVAVAFTGQANRPTLYAAIKQAIEEANLSYINSGINLRMELARTYKVNSDDVEDDRANHRSRSKKSLDDFIRFMRTNQTMKDLRRDYGADIAGVIVKNIRPGGSVSGDEIKHAFSSTGEPSSSNRHRAFFYVRSTKLRSGDFMLAHEVGHLLGAQHNLENTTRRWFNEGFGYCDCENNFMTIMAYNCGCSEDDPPVVPYWSNPNSSFIATLTESEINEKINQSSEGSREERRTALEAIKIGATNQSTSNPIKLGRTSEQSSNGPFSTNNTGVLNANAGTVSAFIATPNELLLNKLEQAPKAGEFADAIGKTTVKAEGLFAVNSDAIVHLRAGEKVILGSGFSVKKGGKFRARVESEIKNRN